MRSVRIPTLLVLYPTIGTLSAEIRNYLTRQRRAQGLRVFLADESVDVPDNDIFDEVIEMPPSEYVKEAYDLLRHFCGRHKLDAIYMQSEAALPVGSLLAREFGLPGPSVESVHLCLNKYLSRERLSDCDILTPQFALGQSIADVYQSAGKFGYPLVLKATSSAHSRLVTLVQSSDEVESAVLSLQSGLTKSQEIARLSSFADLAHLELGCSPTRQFLIESFVGGDAVESDGIIGGEAPMTFGITQQIPSKTPPFYIEGYLFPAEYSEDKLDQLQQLSDQVITSVGLNQTGFSVEMRTTADCSYVIEVNGRLGRDDGLGEMFEACTGFLPLQQAFDLALGKHLECVPADRSCAAIAYQCYYGHGVVEQLPDRNDIRLLNGKGMTYGTMCQLGTRMYQPPHPDVYPHLVWVLATHPTSSRAAYATARAAADQLSISVRPVLS